MKRLLIGDSRERLLTTLEVILKNWGYRALVTSKPEELKSFIEESSPDLLIIGASLLVGQPAPLWQLVADRVNSQKCPLIVIGEAQIDAPVALPHEYLEFPPDVFALFSMIQRHINKHPRHNLRLSVHLPGMLCVGNSTQLSEVLSLSCQGLFIKTGCRMKKEDRLKVIFPLIGMKQELEMEGRVLYRVEPDPENNYLQGVGIEFIELSDENRRALDTFIEKTFIGELSEREKSFPEIAQDQLRNGQAIILRPM
ncbi:MAG: PilZ domain-containing protein [Desulfuromonadales bacterium]